MREVNHDWGLGAGRVVEGDIFELDLALQSVWLRLRVVLVDFHLSLNETEDKTASGFGDSDGVKSWAGSSE